MARLLICALVLLTVAGVSAQDAGLLEVTGRGAEDRPAYDGGGTLRFTEVRLGAQVLHYDGREELALPLEIDYEVLEPAPIVLSSSMGTEYWRLYHFGDETMGALYTREHIDLSAPGAFTAAPEERRAWLGARYGPLPAKGLVGIRGHYYFLIEPAGGGQWLDVASPPPFFDGPEVARTLTFTLADLSEYSVAIAELQSTWEAGGPLRVQVTVTDAAGEAFPVVNAPLTVSAGEWQADLATEFDPLNEPTGWLRATLPDEVPVRISVAGMVTVLAPGGEEQIELSQTFRRGEGQVDPAQMQVVEQGYELPRNADGVIRETRAIWVHSDDFTTQEAIDNLVARATRARLNVLVPIIAVRDYLWARSEIMPRLAEDADDPLAMLIAAAHAAGLEVHPWFCTTYRDPAFRAWFEQQFGVNVDVVKEDGSVARLPADAHRPQYRDFMVELMVGIARDYEVDGIHHDYVRVMENCYCDECRAEFAEQFGKPITEATEEDWIAWHRQAIGDIVRRTAEGVRAVRPDAIISAAVFSSMRGGAMQGQDPAGWARAGWVDVVIPMDYAMQGLLVRSNERQFLEALDDDDALVTGLSLYQRAGTEVSSRPPDLVRTQIELVRSMGIHGYCLFAFGHLSDEQVEMLHSEANPEPAVPYFR